MSASGWRAVHSFASLCSAIGFAPAVGAALQNFRGVPVAVPAFGATVLLPPDRGLRHQVTESLPKMARLASYVRSGDLVFDVGSHVGLFSRLAADRGARRVVAVEPDRDLEALFRANTRGRPCELVQQAVAGHIGEGTLWRNPRASQTSSLDRRAAEAFGSPVATSVELVTLSGLARRFGQPDVIKLDIQGFEHQVVDEGWEVIASARVVLIEVMFLTDPTAMLTRLTSVFGPWELVNDVYAGADLAFQRGPGAP